jgi:hypothetical protein
MEIRPRFDPSFLGDQSPGYERPGVLKNEIRVLLQKSPNSSAVLFLEDRAGAVNQDSSRLD